MPRRDLGWEHVSVPAARVLHKASRKVGPPKIPSRTTADERADALLHLHATTGSVHALAEYERNAIAAQLGINQLPKE